MTILNYIQDTAKAGYNLIGATGLRAGAAATKVAVGYATKDGIMIGAGITQGILACTTSLLGNTLNHAVGSSWATPIAIMTESVLTNGALYANKASQTSINTVFVSVADNLYLKKLGQDIKCQPEVSYSKMACLTAADLVVEGVIKLVDHYCPADSTELDLVLVQSEF